MAESKHGDPCEPSLPGSPTHKSPLSWGSREARRTPDPTPLLASGPLSLQAIASNTHTHNDLKPQSPTSVERAGSPAEPRRTRTCDVEVLHDGRLGLEVALVNPRLFKGDGEVVVLRRLGGAPENVDVGDTIIAIDSEPVDFLSFSEIVKRLQVGRRRVVTFRRVLDHEATRAKKALGVTIALKQAAALKDRAPPVLSPSSPWRKAMRRLLPYIFTETFTSEAPVGIDLVHIYPPRTGCSIAIVERVHPLAETRVQPGDSVVSINGENVRKLKFSQIVEKFRTAPTPRVVGFYHIPGHNRILRQARASIGETLPIERPLYTETDRRRATNVLEAFGVKAVPTAKDTLSPQSKWRKAQSALMPYVVTSVWEEAGPLGLQLKRVYPPKTGSSVAVVEGVEDFAGGKAQIGDSIVSVNGLSVRKLNFPQILRFLAGAKFPKKLGFMRHPYAAPR